MIHDALYVNYLICAEVCRWQAQSQFIIFVLFLCVFLIYIFRVFPIKIPSNTSETIIGIDTWYICTVYVIVWQFEIKKNVNVLCKYMYIVGYTCTYACTHSQVFLKSTIYSPLTECSQLVKRGLNISPLVVFFFKILLFVKLTYFYYENKILFKLKLNFIQ